MIKWHSATLVGLWTFVAVSLLCVCLGIELIVTFNSTGAL